MVNVEAMRDENNRQSQNLSKENQIIYTDIVCYLRVSDLSELEQEDVCSDILSMFLDWQNQGKKFNEMIGEDYKQFADNIINAINPRKSLLKRIKEYILIIVEAFGLLLTIDFVFLYLPQILKGNFALVYDYTLDMAARGLIILIVAVALVIYIGKKSFYLSKQRLSKPIRFLIGGSAGLLLALMFIMSKALKGILLFSINIYVVIAIISLFWLYKGITKFTKKA
jgi:DNA-binding ferritin-like protein (Dps family)